MLAKCSNLIIKTTELRQKLFRKQKKKYHSQFHATNINFVGILLHFLPAFFLGYSFSMAVVVIVDIV